jgi:hypothetical protein
LHLAGNFKIYLEHIEVTEYDKNMDKVASCDDEVTNSIMNIVNIASRKIHSGQRLDFAEALALYQEDDLLKLASLARIVKERKSGHNV